MTTDFVNVISRSLKHHLKVKNRTAVYSRALQPVRGPSLISGDSGNY